MCQSCHTLYTCISMKQMLWLGAMSASNNPNSYIATAIKRIAPTSLTLTACLFLVSCGNSNVAKIATKPFKSVANLIPKRIPIAEVRTEDLKEMPTGAEKALAFERKRNRKRFAFIPGFYKAPTLPDAQSLPADGGILPPIRRPAD